MYSQTIKSNVFISSFYMISNSELLEKLRQFLVDEARSCSMDFGCVTPLYVYRMWGGKVNLEEIKKAMSSADMLYT